MPADATPALASPDLAGADEPETDGGGRGRRASGDEPDLALLEREGDIAADYLEALLDIADLDGDIDIDVEAREQPSPSSAQTCRSWSARTVRPSKRCKS